jgi:energy-coupling factor transporter ATP-binding protein EcfA2
MTDRDRADRFRQALNNLGLFPLLDAREIEAFRVDYGRRTLLKLKQEVLASPVNGKVIFTGHRGCGTSTLLYEFTRVMQQQNQFVVFFSIANASD